MVQPLDHQAYAAQMVSVRAILPEDALQRLRALRLWHWQEVVSNRSLAEKMDTYANDRRYASSRTMYVDLHRHYTANANMHLSAVQWLNDYFEVGDNADIDAALPARVE